MITRNKKLTFKRLLSINPFNRLFLLLFIFLYQISANAEDGKINLITLKWDHNQINIANGRDVVLLDATSCMIVAPVYYEAGLAKYDSVMLSPDKKYYWISVSGILNEISILNYSKIIKTETDVSKENNSGRHVTIQELDISNKYYIYRVSKTGVDPYFFYSNFGVKFIEFKEKIRPGKYLVLEKQEHKIIASKVFDVLPDDNEKSQIFQWSLISEEKFEFDISNLREYSEVSALCNLFYEKYRNSENSIFSYFHGYIFSRSEKK
jgi:hypothetical protein